MNNNKFKVSIIGCGNVGATTAYTLLNSGLTSELLLFDINREKTEGLVLDFKHSAHFSPNTKLTAAKNLNQTKNSDLIIITAGQRQKPGQTRPELIEANKKIFDQIIPKISKYSPNSILLIVSNPVDALTKHALDLSKFPRHRVFGTGTLLDTARFRSQLNDLTKIHPNNIHAYILGEHGDSSFPVLSSANIAGQPLQSIISKKEINQAFTNTQKAAYRIIHDLGFTCYSIAQVCKEITKSIKNDSNQIYPVSVNLNGEYNLKNVSLSLPCQINRNGIQKIIEIPLNSKERKSLQISAQKIQKINNPL